MPVLEITKDSEALTMTVVAEFDASPTRARVALDPTAAGTRMTMVSTFGSVEQLEQLAEMGMQEGLREALGQIDALLAA